MELTTTLARPRSKNLVFTSAGDRSNVGRWLTGARNFDLWVVYYGNLQDSFRNQAEYYFRRKGSKFQNLHYCYARWKEIFEQYDSIMVMDDDILIGTAGLNRLFDLRKELDLWVLQPAFRIVGKISWNITRVRPTTRLRFTNFVEMACPLFRRDKLDAFMAVYDPELVGFGVDWWFLSVVGSDLDGHVAIVDEVTCVNPQDRLKGGVREIDRLQSKVDRQVVWERLRTRHGITPKGAQDQTEFGNIRQTPVSAAVAWSAYLSDLVYMAARNLGGRIVRIFKARLHVSE